MAGIWIHTFTVEGSWGFPTDMLRYDVCAPARSEDVDKIVPSTQQGTHRVQLNRFGPRNWTPTSDRWSSFGWRVVQHDKRAWS